MSVILSQPPIGTSIAKSRNGGRRDEKFSSMLGEQLDIADKLKTIDRRLPVLKKHLEQATVYLKFKDKKGLDEADKILFTAAVG